MANKQFDAIIIGAGFSGLYQLHLLRDKLGIDARVLEMADGVGGTWYWNRYPGARCDSESHSYSYYFSDELLTEWEWSERYPGHAEIRKYLNFVADKLNLKKDIQFSTKVTGAEFDEANALWTVHTDAGESFTTTFLITAIGCLSSANLPQIDGLDDFKGEWYHTGLWPHEDVDFTGKRVCQIGTGSTGIQAVPVIAEAADHLTVFQRTANYSIPARNEPLSPELKKEYRDTRDELRQIMHTTPNGHPFRYNPYNTFDVEEGERRQMMEKAWEKGGLRFRGVFQDVLVDKTANDEVAAFIVDKINEIVKDPETARKLSTFNHPFATKRPPIDSHYFEAYNRENVDLIDIKATPIERITAKGVKTSEREYECDIIVFATGFDAMTGTYLKMDIKGRGGQTLKDAWHAGPRNYLGVAVDGFPNLFTLTGPGSPSVLCNMPVAIEQHVEWVAECIDNLRKSGKTMIEAEPNTVDDWILEVNEAANATLLPLANSSWYLGANVPGKPRVFMPYAGGMEKFRNLCKEVANEGYRGFKIS